MASHKFAVGSVVLIISGRFQGALAARWGALDVKEGEQFEVVRLLPEEGRVPQYRIRSLIDGHERIVREDELQRASRR